LRIVRQVLWEDFDCDVAPETGVSSPVHVTHASRPERTEDLVRTQSIAGSE
jgi:hypothetical protein